MKDKEFYKNKELMNSVEDFLERNFSHCGKCIGEYKLSEFDSMVNSYVNDITALTILRLIFDEYKKKKPEGS